VLRDLLRTACLTGLAVGCGLVSGRDLAAGGPVRTDLYGDPLPAGAVARLGTVRCRHTGQATVVGFLDGGRQFVTFCHLDGFRVWDAATGRELCCFGAPADRKKGPFTHPLQIGLSADGRALVEAREDATLRTWDVTTGRELSRCKLDPGGLAHGGGFQLIHPVKLAAATKGFALGPDGKTLAVWAFGRHIRLLDARTGKDLRRFPVVPHRPNPNADSETDEFDLDWDGPYSLAFLADGRTLVSFDGESIDREDSRGNPIRDPVAVLTFWDVPTGKVLRQVKQRTAEYPVLAVAPDGKSFAHVRVEAGGHTLVDMGDPVTDKILRRLDDAGTQKLGPDPDWGSVVLPGRLVFSPDGKRLAGRTRDGNVFLWDTESGTSRRLLDRRTCGFAVDVVFAPDGRTLAVSTENAVRIWDVSSGRERIPTVGHKVPVRGLAAAGTAGSVWTHDFRTLCRWDIGGRPQARLSLPPGPESVLLSPDGRTILMEQWVPVGFPWDCLLNALAPERYGGISVARDTTTGRPLRVNWQLALASRDGKWAFSPDGRTLGWRDRKEEHPTIRRWDLATGKALAPLNSANVAGSKAGAPLLAFGPGGRTAVTTSVWWQPASNTEKPGGIIRFWDLTSGREVFQFDMQGERYAPCELVLSPDERTLVSRVGWGEAVELWESATGKKRGHFEVPAQCIACSPDSRSIAAGCADGTVRVWDARTCRELARWSGHDGEVHCLAWTADGRSLVSGADDTTALVWDVASVLPRPRAGQLTDQEVEKLWKDLADEDAAAAYRAIAALVAAPEEAVSYLGRQLRPAPAVGDREIARLIADLDSDEFTVRRRAAAELEKLEDVAGPAMRRALGESPSAEVRRGAGHVLGKLKGRVPAGEEIQALRAVEVLEQAGTAEACQVLRSLAAGRPQARLTQEARDALRRLAGPVGAPLDRERGGP
jgi:WD40 repeat protein